MIDGHFLRHLSCGGGISLGIEAFLPNLQRSPPPTARSPSRLRAAVFTTDVANGNMQSPFSGCPVHFVPSKTNREWWTRRSSTSYRPDHPARTLSGPPTTNSSVNFLRGSVDKHPAGLIFCAQAPYVVLAHCGTLK